MQQVLLFEGDQRVAPAPSPEPGGVRRCPRDHHATPHRSQHPNHDQQRVSVAMIVSIETSEIKSYRKNRYAGTACSVGVSR